VSGIAVVTIVRGRHDHLARQQASLALGCRPPDHVVVVAMNDPDVADVVAAGPLADRTRVIEDRGERLPLARARNLGAAAAFHDLGARLAVFLDVDCLAAPDLVAGYVDGWDRTAPGPRLLSGTISYLGPPRSDGYRPADLAAAVPHAARPAPAPGELRRAEDLRLFWSLSFAVDAATWALVGGFDEAYVGYGGEDTDFGQRATVVRVPLWWVGGARAFHQWHPVSDPPVEHLDDIVRNANRFHEQWGWFPMEGWLHAFAARGLAAPVSNGTRWRTLRRGSCGLA
jgi:GT2 family glycosyltransferase